MTEHLPECLVPDFEAGRWICICKQLRACEERAVLHAELRWKADEEEVQQVTFQDGYKQGQRNVFARHDDWIVTGVCEQDCPGCRRLTELITEREKGYAEGLDAAREAVEAMNLHGCFPHQGPIGCNCIGPQVIAAIDALREGDQP